MMSDCSVISGITLIMWLRLQFAFFNCIFTHSEFHRSSSRFSHFDKHTHLASCPLTAVLQPSMCALSPSQSSARDPGLEALALSSRLLTAPQLDHDEGLVWCGLIILGRKWQPLPIFLPGKAPGQRSLVGCSPRGHERVRHDLTTQQQHHHHSGQSLTVR